MEIKPPTADELSVLLTHHAHRFPEKHTVSLPGDRGSTVRVPIVIGNSSGACKMPLGEKPSAAWSNFIGALFKTREDSVDLVRQLAADCLLWPSAVVWAQIVERWPGAPDTLWQVALEKCGASMGLMLSPEEGETAPAPIAAALDKYERAVWRRFNPPGQRMAAVIDAPKSIAWTFFSDAMKKVDADRWALVCEMASMAVPAAVRIVSATMQTPETYEDINFVSDVMPRWPGLAVHVALTLSRLAGVGAQVERDGW